MSSSSSTLIEKAQMFVSTTLLFLNKIGIIQKAGEGLGLQYTLNFSGIPLDDPMATADYLVNNMKEFMYEIDRHPLLEIGPCGQCELRGASDMRREGNIVTFKDSDLDHIQMNISFPSITLFCDCSYRILFSITKGNLIVVFTNIRIFVHLAIERRQHSGDIVFVKQVLVTEMEKMDVDYKGEGLNNLIGKIAIFILRPVIEFYIPHRLKKEVEILINLKKTNFVE